MVIITQSSNILGKLLIDYYSTKNNMTKEVSIKIIRHVYSYHYSIVIAREQAGEVPAMCLQ